MAEFTYEVAFKGVASTELRGAFDDCDVSTEPGRTVVRCDPPQLTAVLDRIQALGLELLDVRLVASPTEPTPR